MTGRHAKRTRVVPDGEGGWVIHFASLDQPSEGWNSTLAGALETAHRFEQIRARSRFIEAMRTAPVVTVDITPALDGWRRQIDTFLNPSIIDWARIAPSVRGPGTSGIAEAVKRAAAIFEGYRS